MNLHSRQATLDLDALTILAIRNICRAGFSNETREISTQQQREWWKSTVMRRVAWLYYETDEETEQPTPVGFGLLLLQDDGLWTTTTAVLPPYSGRGYGKEITHDIVTKCPGECRATARKDNPAAVQLHIPEDWDVVDGPDERLVYFRTKAGVTAR